MRAAGNTLDGNGGRRVRQSGVIAMVAIALLSAGVCTAHAEATRWPIRHVVVLFQENIAFDHYFGTYPHALNLAGEPRFHATPETPTVNGLTDALLNHNPNSAKPFRLGPKQAVTCDMDHEYAAEQRAFDGGLMDKFVENTSAEDSNCPHDGVMAYFDGNTVTALWNYAQHFALNDNSFGTGFGPSTPGALNLISGNTHGVTPADFSYGDHAITSQGTTVGDADPQFDDCSSPAVLTMTGTTIADLLNAKHVSWGWFQGGFRPTATVDGKALCGAKWKNVTGKEILDYSPHHEPFQYYQATSNPHHLRPTSVAKIGDNDQANHQYDLEDFYAALAKRHLPAVSFVKAKKSQDGHAGYSDPLDEQTHLVTIIDAIERSPDWKTTAIVIAWDDSDGWYDHAMPPILNGSAVPKLDQLNGEGRCGTPRPGSFPGRCGYGPRLPLLVISAYARVNFVDHTLTDQTSIIRFIEDNWSLGRIGGGSMDALAGSLENMFDFRHARAKALILDSRSGDPK